MPFLQNASVLNIFCPKRAGRRTKIPPKNITQLTVRFYRLIRDRPIVTFVNHGIGRAN